MVPYVNIHTHRPTGRGIELRTAGIHPWQADRQAVEAFAARFGSTAEGPRADRAVPAGGDDEVNSTMPADGDGRVNGVVPSTGDGEANSAMPTGGDSEVNVAMLATGDGEANSAVPSDNRAIQAIGEIGLDYACTKDRATQLDVLRRQLELACRTGLPVVLHCVRAFEPLMRELTVCEPRAVIFHGFIGSPEQARQALARGYCLSFGERTFASPKSLRALRETPLGQLFFETDDAAVAIEEIYARAAEALGMPEERLKRATLENYERIFGKRNG